MMESMESFLQNIVEFIGVLRAAGIRISNSESIDAIRALECVNLINREEVRTALSVCLAKGQEDRRIFSEAFDRFFIQADRRMEYIKSSIDGIEQKRREINEKAMGLKFRDESISIDSTLKEVYAALPEKEKQSILDFLDRTSSGKNVKEDFRPIVEAMVSSKLRGMKDKYCCQSAPVIDVSSDAAPEAGIIAGDILEAVRRENELLYKNLKDIHDRDVHQMVRMIEALASKMVKSLTRRRQAAIRRSRLDFSRTIGKALATGGVPFRLKYKRKGKPKSKFLVLCDVSASMQRFSAFVLQFLYGMQAAYIHSDCWIFSQEAEHINMAGFSNAMAFEQQITGSPVWRRGTDMSKALWHIMNENKTAMNSSAVLLIVSDAKTLNTADTAEYLNKMAKSVKKIIWLNPIPEEEWINNPFVRECRNAAVMLDCSTLDKLNRCLGGISAGYSTGRL